MQINKIFVATHYKHNTRYTLTRRTHLLQIYKITDYFNIMQVLYITTQFTLTTHLIVTLTLNIQSYAIQYTYDINSYTLHIRH